MKKDQININDNLPYSYHFLHVVCKNFDFSNQKSNMKTISKVHKNFKQNTPKLYECTSFVTVRYARIFGGESLMVLIWKESMETRLSGAVPQPVF